MSLTDFLEDTLDDEEIELLTAEPAFSFLLEEIEEDE